MTPPEYFRRDRTWHPPAFTPDYKTSVARSPRLPLPSLHGSLSETTGPAFGHGDPGPLDNDLIRNLAKDGSPIGERIIMHGREIDENGRGVPHTLVGIRQANAGGRYRHRTDHYLAPSIRTSAAVGAGLQTTRCAMPSARPGPAPIPGATGSAPGGPPIFTSRSSATHSASGSSLRCTSRATPSSRGTPPSPRSAIRAAEGLTAVLDMNEGVPLDRLAYRFDIVLRGRRSSFFENSPVGR